MHIFAGHFDKALPTLQEFDSFLNSPTSFFNKHRTAKGVKSSIIDGVGAGIRFMEKEEGQHEKNPFFTFLTIFANPHTEWDIADVPYSLRQYRDQLYADDLPVWRVPQAGENAPIHTKYGIDPAKGGIVVVRPDGYVGAVTSFDKDGFEALNQYFAGFLTGAGANGSAAKVNGVNGH